MTTCCAPAARPQLQRLSNAPPRGGGLGGGWDRDIWPRQKRATRSPLLPWPEDKHIEQRATGIYSHVCTFKKREVGLRCTRGGSCVGAPGFDHSGGIKEGDEPISGPHLVRCATRCTIWLGISFISEASSRNPFVFSTLRQPRCMEWMALVDLMVTL